MAKTNTAPAETTTARLDFGVKTSDLLDASKTLGEAGNAYIKASKVAALAAVLQGDSVDNVALRTGVPTSTIKRTAALVRNGRVAREGVDGFTPADVSKRLHDLDWSALILKDYDEILNASFVWDDFLTETKASRSADPMSAVDFGIFIYDQIVKAHETNDADAWITAAEHALANVQANLFGEGAGE